MLISGANPSVLEQQGPISVGAIIGIDDFGILCDTEINVRPPVLSLSEVSLC